MQLQPGALCVHIERTVRMHKLHRCLVVPAYIVHRVAPPRAASRRTSRMQCAHRQTSAQRALLGGLLGSCYVPCFFRRGLDWKLLPIVHLGGHLRALREVPEKLLARPMYADEVFFLSSEETGSFKRCAHESQEEEATQYEFTAKTRAPVLWCRGLGVWSWTCPCSHAWLAAHAVSVGYKGKVRSFAVRCVVGCGRLVGVHVLRRECLLQALVCLQHGLFQCCRHLDRYLWRCSRRGIVPRYPTRLALLQEWLRRNCHPCNGRGQLRPKLLQLGTTFFQFLSHLCLCDRSPLGQLLPLPEQRHSIWPSDPLCALELVQ